MLHGSQDHANTVIGTPYYLSPEICQQQPYLLYRLLEVQRDAQLQLQLHSSQAHHPGYNPVMVNQRHFPPG